MKKSTYKLAQQQLNLTHQLFLYLKKEINKNSNSNNNSNSKINTSNIKNNNNRLITLVLPNTNTKFNKLTFQEEKMPVPKEVLLSQKVNVDKHPQKKNKYVC